MTRDQFKQLDKRMREVKHKIFRLSNPDECVSEDKLVEVERVIGVALPVSYRQFLMDYGGGDFGLVTIFSADPSGEWYLPDRLADAKSYLPEGLIPISDDFAGGLYVVKVENGQAQERIWYWNQDGGLSATPFGDVYEYVAEYAYESA